MLRRELSVPTMRQWLDEVERHRPAVAPTCDVEKLMDEVRGEFELRGPVE